MSGYGRCRVGSQVALRGLQRMAWSAGVRAPRLATKDCCLLHQLSSFRLRFPDGGGNGAAHRFSNEDLNSRTPSAGRQLVGRGGSA
jgi:hypothetical protein